MRGVGAGNVGWRSSLTNLPAPASASSLLANKSQHSQWLNYEAGAFSKDVHDDTVRVTPSMVDFERKNDETAPLGQFRGAPLTKERVEKYSSNSRAWSALTTIL